jgi:hypothetical protein
MPDDTDHPATKLDLADLRVHVDQRFQQIDSRFEQIDSRFEHIDSRFEHIDHRFDQIIEATRDMQTEVLRAFHDGPGRSS